MTGSGPARSKRQRALVAALLVVGGSALACDSGGTSSPPRGPNILIVVTDDQRVGTLGIMPQVRRWFVAGGTRFSHAFATTPQCCPSRASILTGQYAHNHHVLTNHDAPALDRNSIFPRVLQEHGYRTAIVGKYLNYVGSHFDPATVGIDPPHFDDWSTFLGGYYRSLFNVNGKLETVGEYSTRYIADRAAQLLRSFNGDDSRPWMLYVAPYAPHRPYDPQHKYLRAPVPPWKPNAEVRERNRRDKPGYVRTSVYHPATVQKIRRKQLRTLYSVDDLVGRIFRRLKALGEERNTLAFFISDNGYLWGEHGLSAKGPPYHYSVQVPLLMRWPGHVEGGVADPRLVANLDLAPTILQAARVAPDPADVLDGHSLLSSRSRHRVLLEYWGLGKRGIPEWASTRTKTLQYTEYYGPDGTTVRSSELYDLRRDPFELHNLRGDVPSGSPEVARLSARLHRDRTCAGASCP